MTVRWSPTSSTFVLDAYDPDANTFTPFPAIPPSEWLPDSNAPNVALPNGQVLVKAGPNPLLYAPGAAKSAWRPIVSAVTLASGKTYTVSGTQLNGLTTGATVGDDAVFATNFPVVYVVSNVGDVSYFRTFGFDNMAPGQTRQFQFTLPASFTGQGSYALYVAASGISSLPKTVTFP
jgi:hypothetical protein